MIGQMTSAEPRTLAVGDTGINLSQATTLDLISLIRSEYLEIPGLHLTRPQVRRLWHLDAAACDALLDALVSGGFLRRTPSDAYVRAGAGSY
jgi:hypothetical protein